MIRQVDFMGNRGQIESVSATEFTPCNFIVNKEERERERVGVTTDYNVYYVNDDPRRVSIFRN